MIAEIVNLGASVLKSGAALWQAFVGIGNETDDILPFGDLPVYQGLGLTSLPEGADADGSAEGVILRNVSGRKGVVVGGRDTRDSDIVGKMDAGDTALHATGKGKKPQLQLKKKKQMAAFVVPCADGSDAVVVIDGKNNRVQILIGGKVFQISKTDGITISDGQGGGIQISGGEVTILGTLRLAGMPPGMFLLAGPITGVTGTVGAAVPVMGVGGTT